MEFDRVLVIAPHPDDEVLGLGGSISKMVNSGIKVNLLVVRPARQTRRPRFRQKKSRINECILCVYGIFNVFSH